MAVPDFQSFMLPLLKLTADGGPAIEELAALPLEKRYVKPFAAPQFALAHIATSGGTCPHFAHCSPPEPFRGRSSQLVPQDLIVSCMPFLGPGIGTLDDDGGDFLPRAHPGETKSRK